MFDFLKAQPTAMAGIAPVLMQVQVPAVLEGISTSLVIPKFAKTGSTVLAATWRNLWRATW
jgi:uncharacterized protein (DUF2236 family)